jgi:hypothetical protein
MANFISNTDTKRTKAPVTTESIVALFTAFLASLPQMIADERDMAGFPGHDPAVDAWITAADASLAVSKSACHAVLAAAAQPSLPSVRTGETDRALVRVAQLFHKVMETIDPEEVTRLRAHARLRRWAFLIPGHVPYSRATNAQINAALDALEVWLALEDVFDARAADWADHGPDDDDACTAAPTA